MSPARYQHLLDVEQLLHLVGVLHERDLRGAHVDLLVAVEELAAAGLLQEVGHLHLLEGALRARRARRGLRRDLLQQGVPRLDLQQVGEVLQQDPAVRGGLVSEGVQVRQGGVGAFELDVVLVLGGDGRWVGLRDVL